MLKPDGKPFEFELTYPGGSDFIQKLALFLKDNFARAGIAMKLNPQKWVLFIQSLTQKDFEVITLAWGAGGIESDIEQMFHSRTIDGGDNRQAYRSDELDSLIDKAHVTLDVDERMKIWQKCHEILHEDQPYTFMFRSQVRLWADGRVANIKLIPVWGVNYTSTLPIPIEWYIPKDKQRRGK